MTQAEATRSEELEQQRDALTGRIFESALGALDVMSIFLGDRLGYYRTLAEAALTPPELARATATHERYAREWLEQQAVTGILAVDDVAAAPEARRYLLPDAHRDVLLEKDSFNHMVPVAQAVAAMSMQLPAILDCFRGGGGIAWPEFPSVLKEAQENFNRPLFVNILGSEYLAGLPHVHERLSNDPPAAVADVGCGAGWSSIAIARSYPKATVLGLDFDAEVIEKARRNAEEAGVPDRVRFEVQDAAEAAQGSFDLVTVFEAVHDMSRPVEALRAMKGLLKPGGSVLVMEEKVAEEFTAPGDIMERFFYGASIFCCLPGGMAEEPSAATGTVMRPETLRRYATEAGYTSVEVLPLHHDCYRFFELRP